MKGEKFFMKSLIFVSIFLLPVLFLTGASFGYEIPESYTSSITGIDFYPNGARFNFEVKPYDKAGHFKAILPGAFDENSIRVIDPDFVDGDLHVERFSRTRWIPESLKALQAQYDEQEKKVNELKSKRAALEQTIDNLKKFEPQKNNPEKLLDYIKNSQVLRLETENELAELKIKIKKEEEILGVFLSDLNAKSPAGKDAFIEITGRTDDVAQFSAFTTSAHWNLNYILNLNSENGEIEVNAMIKACQDTGLDFKGDMIMHTKNPDERITTPVINPLRVGIKPKVESVVNLPNVNFSRSNAMYKSVKREMAEEDYDAVLSEAALENTIPTGAAPTMSETLSDRIIQIDSEIKGDGIETGLSPLYSMENLKSKITLMMIPEQRNNAWVIADMDSSNEKLIPGSAELRVDGYTTGEIKIKEYGENQKNIPFGYIDQITVKKEALVEKTGVSWFKGIFTSGYKLEITNGTKIERVITVKDRLPIPTDEKIKLDVKKIEPKEKERDKENRLTWEITVPAGETVPIIVDYTLSYPSGEELQYR